MAFNNRPVRASRISVNYFQDVTPGEVEVNGDDSDDHHHFAKDDEDDEHVVNAPDAAPADDDQIETDDDLIEGNPKKTKPQRTTKPPVKVQAQNGKKEIRNSKQITSIKEKFLRFFGNNEQKLVGLIQLRKDWEYLLFTIDPEKLGPQLEPYDLDIPEPKLNKSTKDAIREQFPLKKSPVYFQFESGEIQIIDKDSSVTNDTTTILNTGGLITDLTWLESSSEEQTLVVSITNITNTAISPKFRILSRNLYNAAFQFYKFNIKTKETQLVKTLLHNWGAAWDLKTLNTTVPTISAVFNDGNVRLIRVKDNFDAFITKASVELSILGHIISTYDWLNDDSIIVGTDSGHIAEFNVGDPQELSYLYPLHSDYIFSLSASRSQFDDSIVYSSCSDGTSTIFNTNDIITSINRTSKSRAASKTVLYSPQLYSFIQLEGPYTTKFIPMRANFGSTSISKHDGSAESVALSKIHPFVITGGADGKVKLANMARKILNGQKQSTASHKILTVFNLQYGAKENQYRYLEDQKVEQLPAMDNINNVNIYPDQISINSLKWNENKIAGNWFVAGTTSGLLIFKEIK